MGWKVAEKEPSAAPTWGDVRLCLLQGINKGMNQGGVS